MTETGLMTEPTRKGCAGRPDTGRGRNRRRNLFALAGFLLLCLAVSALGGLATSVSVGTWYQTLAKPAFNPPDWVFAPVWTTLYALMAVAGWRVWRSHRSMWRKRALVAFGLQLALNLVWSVLFFGMREIGFALVEIALLFCAIAATTVLFWRQDRIAGMLFVPYLLWVAFACLLNASIWLLN